MVVLEEWQVVLTVPASMPDDDAVALVAEVDGLLRSWAEGLAARLDVEGREWAHGQPRVGLRFGSGVDHRRDCYRSVCRPSSSEERTVATVEGELQKLVGRNLRQRRTAIGLSQETFADLVGVHRTYMGGIERGERNLTLRSLERIAERLSVDPRELLSP